MANLKEDNLLIEAYTRVLGSTINESIQEDQAEALHLVSLIARHIATTHDQQWPEGLFVQLRDALNRIVFHENHPPVAAEGSAEGAPDVQPAAGQVQ